MLRFKLVIPLLLLVTTLQLSRQNEYTKGIYEGDILLTNEVRRTMEILSNPSDPFSPQHAVVQNEQQHWPNGIVPYELDSSLNSQARTAIQEAIQEYDRDTCVRFIQRTNEEDYVKIYPGGGCSSYVGRISGPQYMSIGYGCEYKGIVMHEMFHALGRWHEQSRPDRDQFVRILTENIFNGTQYNFDRKDPAYVTTQGIPYDMSSLMHYSYNAFSRNGKPTILPIDPNIHENTLGQREGFSQMDIQHVLNLYCGGGGSGAYWSSWSYWSGCSLTCNGGSRVRTRTCNQGSNCAGTNTDKMQCNQSPCPVPASWMSWSAWSECSSSCGGGKRVRSRECQRGNICSGKRYEYEYCYKRTCPQPPTWAHWGSWSSCSRTCQGGIRQRKRTCWNGNECPGITIENEYCNTEKTCETEPPYGQWSSWSKCSAECGGGTRYRVRNCERICETEQQPCNTEVCVPEPEVRGLQHRGCWYLNANARKIGSFEGTPPFLEDKASTRVRPVSKCGATVQKEGYEFFGVSEGYCLSGSHDLSDYQYYSSTLCRGGKGSYTRDNGGWWVMDVYQITNQVSFSDSAFQVNDPNANIDTTDMSTTGTGSGHALTYTLSLIVLAVLAVVMTIAAM